MKILITGATGLVGKRLIQTLYEKGYDEITILTQNKRSAESQFALPVSIFEWNVSEQKIEAHALENIDTVIHLAGENVASGLWSENKKKRILDSRIKSTELLMNSIKKCQNPPKKIISASAIGFYGDRCEEVLDERSTQGEGFLSEVCQKWEQGVLEHKIENLSSYVIRIGLVLSSQGGALESMRPAFKMGVAGSLGDGQQFMSWIHVDDLVRQFIYLVENDPKEKIFNGVSPNPVTNKEFTRTLAKALSRPTFLKIPAVVLKTLLGQMSQILLMSQYVVPQNYLKLNFKYKFLHLNEAINDIFSEDYELEQTQWVDKNLDQVFNFYSDEKNLEKLTPPHLQFQVLKKSTKDIKSGTYIDYKLKLHGIPFKWKSKIREFNKYNYFIDEQITGPYKKWVHKHSFYKTKNGTLIKDKVKYQLPLGFLGSFFGIHYVKKDLKKIFDYRRKIVSETFK